MLQNELGKRLPQAFLESIQESSGGASSGIQLVYSVIPLIKTLPQPLKDEVRVAFADSISVIWQVLTGIIGVGLLCSLLMKDVPIHSKVDMKWALEEKNAKNDGSVVDAEHSLSNLVPRRSTADAMDSVVAK